jgi:hypothetical protein|mmetsp:Transcript_3352/g.3522  ORF Transcript_3352/g.3522 Transcript_3352/m.3522 type:complete len:89 (+) Transcript_3352:143-409(+)
MISTALRLVRIIFFVEIVNAEMTLEQTKLWCLGMVKTHKIQPGRSFGELPITKHNEYLQAECFRFLCEPNPQAGKGVFDCIPLRDSQT